MEVIEVELSKIKPYGKNPRKNDEAVDYVANSIKEFGFKNPIIVDKNYEIICGHTRYKAACKLGLMGAPIIVASDLTPKQVKALRIADNKVAEFSDWDFNLLNEEMDLDFDFSDFGFDFVKTEKKTEKAIKFEEPKTTKTIECPGCGLEIEL